MEIYKSVEQCEKQIIVKMSPSIDGQFLGIKTTNGVLFLKAVDRNEQPAYDKAVFIVCDISDVPNELLNSLKVKMELVSTDVPQIITREK